MADVTGALHYEFGGRRYCMRLTLGGIASLQGRYGNDLAGMLSGEYDVKAGQQPQIPPFEVMISILAVALGKGEGMDVEEATILADDMLTADQTVLQRVLAATFPEAVRAGKGRAVAKGG